MTLARLTITLEGPGCASEAQSLERVIAHAPGVHSVYVNPVTSRATIDAERRGSTSRL